jgi:hypothetical protein
MRFYCTHFDINYVAHARSLYDSLLQNSEQFILFMFCQCDESYQILTKNPYEHAIPIHFSRLEQFIPSLLTAKGNRTKVEYFYTCGPAVCNFVLQNFENIDIITYLDADLYFFSSPEPLFLEFGDNSIGIIDHKFNWLTKRNLRYGRYNVGWISFRNDFDGKLCLTDWMNNCIAWCYVRFEDGKYADQKYLDTWPTDYKNVKVFEHIGANLAIWNIKNYRIHISDNKIKVDDMPLIFYHFANLKQVTPNLFKTDLSRGFIRTSGVIKQDVYQPYILRLLTNKTNKLIIYSKEDVHISGIYELYVIFLRFIRNIFFPDIIKIQ